jgi:O-antigen/teichoic acid export membrane protein
MIKGENSLSSDSKKPDSSKIGLDLSLIYKYFFPVAVSIFSFIFLTNIDVILVKHLFSPENAGFYSIAQIIGKVFLYLPSALAIVMFPKSTTAYVKNSHSHHILYKSLLIAAGLCGAGVIICYLFPEFVLDTLTNRANPVSLELVTLFSLAMSFYAFVWIVVNYMLSTHNLKFVLPLLILAILEGVAIYIWHADLKVVLYVLLSFSIISFLMLFFMSKRINHKRRKLELT